MLPPKKILFPVDYSAPCEAAVPFVRDMLKHYPGELTLVHAYGPEAVALSDIEITDPDLLSRVREVEEKRLRSFAGEWFPGVKAQTVVSNSEASSAALALAANGQTDLIMLATHGHGPVRRFLLGSVAAKILHDSDCAVWTATGTVVEGHTPHTPCRSILCAVSEGEEAEAVVRTGAMLAKTYDARLAIAHVVETPVAAAEIDYAPLRNQLVDAADLSLRALKEKAQVNTPHRVLDGSIPDSIRDEAIRRHADLIVTGRGRIQGAVSRLWAHLYSIVRESPCPVLSI